MSAVVSARKVRAAIWILLAALAGAGAIWYVAVTATKPASAAPLAAADAQLIRDDSHRCSE